MTKQGFEDALSNLISVHSQKTLANCIRASENPNDLEMCLTKNKQKLKEAFETCAVTKFRTNNDRLILLGFDRCVEDK